MIKRGHMKFESNFTIIPNAWARDKRLSRRARGLLLELASHRPGWEVTLASLVEAGTDGIGTVRACIKELNEAGYLTVERQRDELGRVHGTDYTLSDPFAEVTESPMSVSPKVAEAYIGETATKKTMSFEEENLEEDQCLFEAPAEPINGRGADIAPVRKRRTQAPDKFVVTAELESWARSNAPSVAGMLEFETKKFLAHNVAKGTTYIDWTAAWRNWMLKAHEWAAQAARGRGVATQVQAQPAHNGRRLNINYDEPDTGDATGYSTSTR
jgi:hypothetical protein